MATPATIVKHALPTVVLVGRVNVGKSTLFNRLTETTQALVSEVPGTTRTRNIGFALWRGKHFRLVDTGGLTFSDKVVLEEEIIDQTEQGLKEADLIVMVVDLKNGMLPQEITLAKKLRQQFPGKPVLLAGNKADSPEIRLAAHAPEWRKLGMGEPHPISAQNSSGLGDFLDLMFKDLGKMKKNPKNFELPPPATKVALVGKPNVGKSSLFNKLIGEDRVIVNPMPHTTREPHDTLVEVDGQLIVFVDTAGIRRKTKVSGILERAGIKKSIEIAERADVTLLLLDTAEPVTDQDQQLGGLLRDHARSVIIIVNKWDLADENDDAFRNEVKEHLRKKLPHLDYAPIVFVSAKNGYRVHQIFPLITEAMEGRKLAIPDEELGEFLKEITKKRLPTKGKGVRHPRIINFRQINANPPVFEIEIKSKTSLHMSYVRYIENRLRERFGFFATPVIIKLTKVKR